MNKQNSLKIEMNQFLKFTNYSNFMVFAILFQMNNFYNQKNIK